MILHALSVFDKINIKTITFKCYVIFIRCEKMFKEKIVNFNTKCHDTKHTSSKFWQINTKCIVRCKIVHLIGFLQIFVSISFYCFNVYLPSEVAMSEVCKIGQKPGIDVAQIKLLILGLNNSLHKNHVRLLQVNN